jgi:hypothetical protein
MAISAAVAGVAVSAGAAAYSIQSSQVTQAQASEQEQKQTTAENNLVQDQQDEVQQQNSSAQAVATRNSARQAQLTAAANYTGYSGTILTSPLGGSGGAAPASNTSKTVLGS